MTRQQVVLLLRSLLKRMEEEEWEFNENFGHDCVPVQSAYKYVANKRDTFTLRFTGPKQNSEIPNILIVWPDSTTEYRPWRNLRGLSKRGERPTLLYCPIDPNTITPEKHRLNVLKQFQLSNVQYIKET